MTRFRPDARSRADKLRDLAAHPNTNKHERDRALDELRRMGERAPEPAPSARRARLRMLSVREPWASEIASGKKTVELRKYAIAPGPLGIASTAEGKSPGRLLCVVDVVECLRPGHPWLREHGVPSGLWGIVLENPRSAAVKPAVSGQQGIWHLEVEGEWADLVEGQAPSSRPTGRYAPSSPPSPGRVERASYEEVERQRQERQSREARQAREARASAEAERQRAAADRARDEAARKAEAASRVKESPEETFARTRQQIEAEHAAEARRFAEMRARQAEVLAAEEARRRKVEEDAHLAAEARWVEATSRKVSAYRTVARAADDRAAVLERSPFRVRGESDPCPVCRDGALAGDGAGGVEVGRRYRCDKCGQNFSVIRSGEFLMYYRG